MNAKDEALTLFFEACDGTHLETRGSAIEITRFAARRERRRREIIHRERALHIVAEPAHGHALGMSDPFAAVARRSGFEHQRHEYVPLHPGEPNPASFAYALRRLRRGDPDHRF